MWSWVAVHWVTFSLTGASSLLLLLVTLALSKSLPSRNNHFLINFLLTTFLATIPPCLLFFAGQQDAEPSHWLCFTQTVLMDGIAPMVGGAQVVLAFQTWANLRAITGFKMWELGGNTYAKWIFLLIPYITLAGWCTASLVDTLQPSGRVELFPFVYCHNESSSIPVRKWIGPFMILCTGLELSFEVAIAFFVYNLFKSSRSIRKSTVASCRDNLHLSLRLIVFSCLQLIPTILAVLNVASVVRVGDVGDATQIVESMVPLMTFLVFATQRSVLEAWRICRPSTACEHEEVVNQETLISAKV